VADVCLGAKDARVTELNKLPLRRASNAQKKKSHRNESMNFHNTMSLAKIPTAKTQSTQKSSRS
jgi:hypothetical protein